MKIATLSLIHKALEGHGGERRGGFNGSELLDRIGMRTGESRLARLLARADANTSGSSSTSRQLLLELGGQQIPVRSERALETGNLVRVMRAGNELQLMDIVGQPQRSTLAQSLAQKIPSQHHLGDGLSQLLNRPSDSTVPEPARQAIQRLLQMLPRLSVSSTTLSATPAPQSGAPVASTSTATLRAMVQTALAPQTPGGTATRTGPTNPTQSLAPPETMTAQRVRDWFSNSGLFREAQLITRAASLTPNRGSTSTAPPTDLKAQLIQAVAELTGASQTSAKSGSESTGSKTQVSELLRNALRGLRPATTPELTGQDALRFPAPVQSTTVNPAAAGTAAPAASSESMNAGETLRLLAGMINRITVNQLHSQAASAGGSEGQPANQTWVFELPWVSSSQEVKLIQGRIEEREPGDENDHSQPSSEREWRLNLALDFEATGPIYFDVALKGRELRTTVWAERPATVSLVRGSRQHLENALSRLDLEVKPVECFEGKPTAMVTRLSQHLVDEHA